MTTKPNIIFFLVDDLGWADVGYNGATYHLTPNIDAFAKRSLVFDNAYTMPTCSPARASLFTGLASPHTGIYHVENYVLTPEEHFGVKPVKSGHFYDKPITMLGDSMKSAGYATGYVGKWHVTEDPLKHGFDFNAGGCGKGGPASYFSPYKNPALSDGPEGEYLPDRLFNEAAGFIKNHKDEPFFLCYATYLVHRPLEARPEDVACYEERETELARHDPVYAAMVGTTDRILQSVLDLLKDEGIDENTVIIFTSDNGINGLVGDSTPLRGSKGTCYEGGVRVPTMVYWPQVTESRHTEALVDIVDWYPTILEMAGAQGPPHELDGTSLVPLLRGQCEITRKSVFWHMPCYNGRPEGKHFWQTPFSAIRTGNDKLIYFYEDERSELYDLGKDIGETTDLSAQQPEKTTSLLDDLKSWLEQMDAPQPTPLTQ